MGITGNLKTMQLGELLQWLSLGSKTGTLLIDGHGVEKRVYFQDGRIASTSSSDQREYLGHFLVSHGFITEEELKMAMEVQEESQILLGKILVMINAIAESDLLRLMKKKAEESIYDIFLWTEGDFEFVEDQMPDQKMVPSRSTSRASSWRACAATTSGSSSASGSPTPRSSPTSCGRSTWTSSTTGKS